ncbi:uncharacterized protein G2W53_027795 [Senna tora]|uniref:Uncharacterized protein n=1 Tax=Senna tora TaxID=362788 RepID=A0A834TJY1_9FABA|nr:uncharacterized protein G2W53_027795 [Senna tora]
MSYGKNEVGDFRLPNLGSKIMVSCSIQDRLQVSLPMRSRGVQVRVRRLFVGVSRKWEWEKKM